MTRTCGHVVEFYDDDFDLVAAVADFMLSALRCDGRAIVVATPSHNAAIDAALRVAGIDTALAQAEQRLMLVDAADLLASLSRDGRPDQAKFEDLVGSLINRVAKPGRELRIYGEMVALLWANGEVAAAMELEEMWNNLRARLPFGLMCGYPANPTGEGTQDVRSQSDIDSDFEKVSRLHTGARHGHMTRMISRSFGADISAPHLARTFVGDTLRDWNCEDLVEDGRLIVSELATNAVIHGRTDFTVRMHRAGEAVRIAVYDTADTAPVQIDAPALATGGRGLAMVASVSEEWGCDAAQVGKTVWADLHFATPA